MTLSEQIQEHLDLYNPEGIRVRNSSRKSTKSYKKL